MGETVENCFNGVILVKFLQHLYITGILVGYASVLEKVYIRRRVVGHHLLEDIYE